MKYLPFTVFILLSCATYVYGMNYAVAPFTCAYHVGSFIFGKKTFLEYEIDSFLKTVSLSRCTTEEELKNFVTKKTKKHLKNKVASSSLFFAYLMASLVIHDHSAFDDKVLEQIDLFVADKATKFKPSKDTEKLKSWVDEKNNDIL